MRGNDDQQAGRRLRPAPPADVPAPSAQHELETIVGQAAAAVGTSMAIVSLLDRDRRWLQARVGIAAAETSLVSSFCTHAIRGAGVLTVADASQDPRFACNPLVTGRPHIRFYAGTALLLGGLRIGTLCVLDDQPHQSFSALHERYLTYLADRTIAAVRSGRPT